MVRKFAIIFIYLLIVTVIYCLSNKPEQIYKTSKLCIAIYFERGWGKRSSIYRRVLSSYIYSII